MSKSIYIATTESNSGKSLLSLGVLRMMLTKSAKVGYFRPVINDSLSETDNHIKTAIDFFGLNLNYEDCYAYKQKEILQLLGEDKLNIVLNTVIEKYKKLEEKFDYVLVDGSDFSKDSTFTELDLNQTIAKNLGIPALIVGSGKGKTLQEFSDSLFISYQSFIEKEVDIIGLVANKVNKSDLIKLKNKLEHKIPNSVQIDIIPKVNFLENPTVKEVSNALNGNILFGKKFLNNSIGNFTTGAMQLRNYLNHLKDDTLVITPGDRADIILGALQANISSNYPKIAGIILTGNLIPEDSILKLIEGVKSTVPIVSVKDTTFNVANKVGAVQSKIYASNEKKILLALDIFDTYVNAEQLSSTLTSYSSEKLTPRMFQYNMLQKAKQKRKHIVLPEGEDLRIIQAP